MTLQPMTRLYQPLLACALPMRCGDFDRVEKRPTEGATEVAQSAYSSRKYDRIGNLSYIIL